MATIQGKSADGKTYDIGSEKGQSFVNSAAAGTTMTGGDGSTWTKNSDGSTTISKNGTTYTVHGSGSGSGGGGSSGGSGKIGSHNSSISNTNPGSTGYSASAATKHIASATDAAKASSGGGSGGGGGYGGSNGPYATGKVYKVGSDGKAPPGMNVGDDVVTGGGTYRITAVHPDGTYERTRINNVTTDTYSGVYVNAPYGGAQGLDLWTPGGINGSDGKGGFVADGKGDFVDAEGNEYSHLQWDLLTDGTIRNIKTGEIRTYNSGDNRTGKKSVFADVVKAYGENGDLVIFSSPEEVNFFNNAPAGTTMHLNGATYTKNKDGGVTIVTNGERRVYSTPLDNGTWTQKDSSKASGGGHGGGGGGGGSTQTGMTVPQGQTGMTMPQGQSGMSTYQGQSKMSMPNGWTEYAYDAEGKPFTMSTQAAYDFLYNSSAKSMTGGNGIKFVRNDDGSVTITEQSGRTSVWRPGGTGMTDGYFSSAQNGMSMPDGWTEYAYDAEGKPFTMSTEAAFDFLYNSIAKFMTGANGIQFARNDDGSVTITEQDGRVSVWRPGGMGMPAGQTGTTYSPSFKSGEQKLAELQLSAYDAAYLAPEDQQAVAALKQAYADAKAKGDKDAMEASNEQANAIRAKYGYTGGGDGATFRLMNQEQKRLDNIDLGSYESALQGMRYTPQAQGGNWTDGLTAASPTENLTGYTDLAGILSPNQMSGYDLGNYRSALEGQGYQPVQQGYNGSLNQMDLGNFGSAIDGVSQAPAGLKAGTAAPADYTSALAGMKYNGPSRAAEQALGNVSLGTYQSALAGLQYTPQGNIQEQALGRTVLSPYQSAYTGLTAPNLANLDYSKMQNAALPGYQAQLNAVNQVYSNQQAAALAGLKSAYESSRAEKERGMSKIASAYQQQKNTTASESEIARRNYQEQAAASGLNAGNRGQAALAFSTSLQNNLNQLNTAQANAISDAQFELDRLQADYQNQISQAIAQNNYERAAALLKEYQTAQQSRVDTAVQQANLNLQTGEHNRQVRNDQADALQQGFQNQLALAQGQQSDQQAAADLAYRQAGLDLQTAQFDREGRQLQRDTAQQDFQNQLTLAQARDAANQAAWERGLQQANLNMDVAAYNREGRNLDWQAAQQEYANYLNFLQAQEAANQGAFDRSLQTAAFQREGQQMEYDAAMRSYEAALARAQAIDAANQAAWNRAYQQAGLNMDVAQFNREGQAMNNQVRQQNWENQLALSQAQDAARQAAWDRAYQQAGLDLNVRQFNQDTLKDYYQAMQQDFANRMAVNQEARDTQAQAYDQAYRKAQMEMDAWSLNQDVEQRNFQNQLAMAQAQDAAAQDAWNRSLQQAGLDLDVWDRNRQTEQDQLARQQQLFDNQRALRDEQYQQNVFDWQRQQDELDRQERAAQTAWDQQQQKWDDELALTELAAKYNDFNRLAYYGFSPEQIQNMYRFAQMDALGYTW